MTGDLGYYLARGWTLEDARRYTEANWMKPVNPDLHVARYAAPDPPTEMAEAIERMIESTRIPASFPRCCFCTEPSVLFWGNHRWCSTHYLEMAADVVLWGSSEKVHMGRHE